MDIIGDNPDPSDIKNDPSGSAKQYAAFGITAALTFAAGMAGIKGIGQPMLRVARGVFVGLYNAIGMADTASAWDEEDVF